MPDNPIETGESRTPGKAAVLEAVKWNDAGLLPVIAQDQQTGQVLMMAWMNADALQKTIERREAVYWSRSRRTLWHKGESSGHVQIVKDIRLDCDGDTLLLLVEQRGGIACHTGRAHCFFQQLDDQDNWQTVEPVIKDPGDIYHD